MMVFVLHAALVWWAAARWRRRWQSFIAVTGGVLMVAAVILSHQRVSALLGIGQMVPVMVNALLYPYIVLLAAVGYYIAVLPRPVGEGAKEPCDHCGYDLEGIEEFAAPVCPECGKLAVVEATAKRTGATL